MRVWEVMCRALRLCGTGQTATQGQARVAGLNLWVVTPWGVEHLFHRGHIPDILQICTLGLIPAKLEFLKGPGSAQVHPNRVLGTKEIYLSQRDKGQAIKTGERG